MGMLVAIALGGAIGSLARYGVTVWSEQALGAEFPYGILIANVAGSFAIGICFVLIYERALLPEIWRPLLMVGFLGAFTTFSTFSLQAIGLIQEGRLVAASLYVFGSVMLSILGAWLGILATRQFTN
ncbi:MAG: fluoride efflux transporter CrcB [Pseudomonadales bacterium]|nr:fluoride efflux transporter CrcB [Pseudomonadales bacterium]MBO6701750.1 fluoride efflux transporter CrcB [Pseudomonadales bacterium]MBO7007275.1 fluoride efflux transporter CrcB [Pseudomonadales bacterium]